MDLDFYMVTKRKLFRVGERVVLTGQVAYPCLVGDGEGIRTFNQTYAQAAENFLNHGLQVPSDLASEAYHATDVTARYAFVRRQVLCQMATQILGHERQGDPAPKELSSKQREKRMAKLRSWAGEDGCVLKVAIQVSTNQGQGHTPKPLLMATHFWCFPQGWMVVE